MSKDFRDKKNLHSPAWDTSTKKDVLELLQGNEDAVKFIFYLSDISNVYDDLIDKDKPVPDVDIHSLMWNAMVDIPTNKFFIEHKEELLPIITTSLINYHAANQIEAIGDLEELRISHSIRYSLIDVGLMCIKIIGGAEYAAKNARRARLMFQNDTWEHYKSEHYKEKLSGVDDVKNKKPKFVKEAG